MRLGIYQDPSSPPWDITSLVPSDSISLLQTKLNNGTLEASLSLDLFPASDDIRKAIRRPGVLVITDDENNPLFAMFYNPVNTSYDPTKRRYTLNFVSLTQGLKKYVSEDKWWNVLDAASYLASMKEFLSRYVPGSFVNNIRYNQSSMAPLQEDPENPEHTYFAGFIQPASWLVGKEVSFAELPNSPWRVINVLAVAQSQHNPDAVYALVLAKRNGWTSNYGDYVFPLVVMAVWNANTWDWDIEDGYWSPETGGEPWTEWQYPVWFGLKNHFTGETGDSVLLYTTYNGTQERVVVVWNETKYSAPEQETYINSSRLRFVLLDKDLNLLDQQVINLDNLSCPFYSSVMARNMTLILRGVGYNETLTGNNAGVVFMAINGNIHYNPGGGGPGQYGQNGEDGVVGIYAVRWNNSAWVDSSLQMIDAHCVAVDDGMNPLRMLDIEPFTTATAGVYQVLWTKISPSTFLDGIEMSQLTLAGHIYDANTNSITSMQGHTWTLQYKTDTYPTAAMAVPIGPAYYDSGTEYYKAGVVFAYTILDKTGQPNGLFLDALTTPFDGGNSSYTVNPDNAGFLDNDVKLTDGQDDLYKPETGPFTGWGSTQVSQAQNAYRRSLYFCRMRPFALRYTINTSSEIRSLRFLACLHNATKAEVFAIAGTYDPLSDGVDIYGIDGSDVRGDVVPKTFSVDYNEAESWRPVAPYHTVYENDGLNDPRCSEKDRQGNFGQFQYPVGVSSFPVAKKVCDNDHIFSELGRLGYDNMMNEDTRYIWNIYNGHRAFIITPLAWWGDYQTQLDYRKNTNIELTTKMWNRFATGISYISLIDGLPPSPTISLFLVPRFPITGDNRTVGGGDYWNDTKSSVYSGIGSITQRNFGLEYRGRYWDALFLGPQGGALLTNIWWDDQAPMDTELVVSVEDIAPAWFGPTYWQVKKYNDLLEYLRANEPNFGGAAGERVGFRKVSLPVYGYNGQLRVGMIISDNIMADLENTLGGDDPELLRYRTPLDVIIPLYWQIVETRWDLNKNTASITVLETRDKTWEVLI